MERVKKLLGFLQVNPEDPFLKHALALEYIKDGKDEQARKLFIEILTADPGYTGSYYHLASLLERKGDKEAALTWYKKGMAVAKEKGDLHTYNELQSACENLI